MRGCICREGRHLLEERKGAAVREGGARRLKIDDRAADRTIWMTPRTPKEMGKKACASFNKVAICFLSFLCMAQTRDDIGKEERGQAGRDVCRGLFASLLPPPGESRPHEWRMR